jgi:hypothetical protein
MKYVVAIVKPFKLDEVRDALMRIRFAKPRHGHHADGDFLWHVICSPLAGVLEGRSKGRSGCSIGLRNQLDKAGVPGADKPGDSTGRLELVASAPGSADMTPARRKTLWSLEQTPVSRQTASLVMAGLVPAMLVEWGKKAVDARVKRAGRNTAHESFRGPAAVPR